MIIKNQKVKVDFSKTKKGEKARKKYTEMIKKGWERVGVLEVLIAYGYRNEIKTNLYI